MHFFTRTLQDYPPSYPSRLRSPMRKHIHITLVQAAFQVLFVDYYQLGKIAPSFGDLL